MDSELDIGAILGSILCLSILGFLFTSYWWVGILIWFSFVVIGSIFGGVSKTETGNRDHSFFLGFILGFIAILFSTKD